MAKRRIFTVGFELPGDEFEYVAFDSDQTLLDADIILFHQLWVVAVFEYGQRYGGRAILDHQSSFATKRRLDHWLSEIKAAVSAGKLVIIYLAKPLEYYIYGCEELPGEAELRLSMSQRFHPTKQSQI